MGLIWLLLGIVFFWSEALWACPTCGQSFSFTPRLLIISTGFFLLPLSIVALIFWKLYRDEQAQKSGSKDPS
jgi:hypothetical protein